MKDLFRPFAILVLTIQKQTTISIHENAVPSICSFIASTLITMIRAIGLHLPSDPMRVGGVIASNQIAEQS
jgi:hypothetical protein